MIRALAFALVGLALAGAVGVAVLWRLQRALLFPVAGLRVASADVEAAGCERLWLDAFEPARELGAGVLLVEYPGYNRSEGTPSQESVAAAVARPDVDPSRVVGYGRSLGGGAVCALSLERRLAALVLESTFTSVAELARGFGLTRFAAGCGHNASSSPVGTSRSLTSGRCA